MRAFIYRIISVVPICLIVAIIIFLLMRLAPGDPARMMADDLASDQEIDALRERLGLNQTLPIQFIGWLQRVLSGDLGSSLFLDIPVTTLILQRVEPTVSLTIGSILIAILIALPMGALAALMARTWVDRVAMGLAVLGFSLPAFLLGYTGVWVFSIKLQLLPVQGYSPISSGIGPWLQSILLPCLTLGLISSAFLARVTRATVLEILNEDYVRTARAKGLSTFGVMLIHVMKNAGIPIATVIGTSIASLLSGVVIVESVFAIPGIGTLIIDAVLKRDYPVIQGVILVLSVVYIFVNLLVDLSYQLFDPRVRF